MKMLRQSPRRLYLLLEVVRSTAMGSILPVFAVYYRHFDISLVQIALLAAVFEATILICEIPTGIWADRVSRRSAIVLSEICLTLGGVLFVGWPGLWIFIIAEIIQGFGEACGSGSLEAWVVDELQIAAGRKQSEALFAAALRWKTGGLLIGSLAAGGICAWNVRWVWVPFVLCHLLGMLAALAMKEDRPVMSRPLAGKLSTRQIIASGINRLKQSVLLQVLVGFGLLCAFAEEGLDQYWQVYAAESLSLPTFWFGVVVAVPAVFIFLFAPRIIGRLGRRLSPAGSIALLQIGVVAGIAGLAMLGSMPAVCCLAAVFIFVDLKKPIIAAWANRHLDSEHRAGMLSFLNMVSSVGEAGAGLTFGCLAGQAGLRAVFLAAAVVSLTATTLLFFIRNTTETGGGNVTTDEGS